MVIRPGALVAMSMIVAASAAAGLIWRFAIFVLPFAWTGEPGRVADLLRLKSGSAVADIGAGDGALAMEMARRVGDSGVVYATELSPDLVARIEQRVSSENDARQVTVVAGAVDATRLPDACCDAVYMRTVFHHIGDRAAFAREVRKALRDGGRVAIIDFPPGALWFHGSDHGVAAGEVARAFLGAGLSLAERVEDWGGGTYLLLFELTDTASSAANGCNRERPRGLP